MIRLFRAFVPASIFALLISEILLVTGAFVLASFIILPVDPGDYLIYEGGLKSIGLVVLIGSLVILFIRRAQIPFVGARFGSDIAATVS